MRRIPTVTKREESAHVGALLDEGFETFRDSITVQGWRSLVRTLSIPTIFKSLFHFVQLLSVIGRPDDHLTSLALQSICVSRATVIPQKDALRHRKYCDLGVAALNLPHLVHISFRKLMVVGIEDRRLDLTYAVIITARVALRIKSNGCCLFSGLWELICLSESLILRLPSWMVKCVVDHWFRQ